MGLASSEGLGVAGLLTTLPWPWLLQSLPGKSAVRDPIQRRISLLVCQQEQYRLLRDFIRYKQFVWPQFLALAAKLDIDLRKRQLSACCGKVILPTPFHTLNFVTETRKPAQVEPRVLPLAVWAKFSVWRNDHAFPGCATDHCSQHARDPRRFQAHVAVAGDLAVGEFHGRGGRDMVNCDA